MKHTKLGAIVAALGLAAIGLTGCPLTTCYITYPIDSDSQAFTVNAAGQLEMVVRFNKDLRFWTIKPGENVVLDTNKALNVNITIVPGSADNEIVVTSMDKVGAILEFEPDGLFTLTIHGGDETGALGDPTPIVSAEGEGAVDGDKDNYAGGTWVHQYIMLG